METLGHANELNEEPTSNTTGKRTYTHHQHKFKDQYEPGVRRLYRNPNDKLIGGVCSGVANYFDIDPVLVRLVFAILFLTAGIGLVAYILAWIIIPVARTPQEMYYMSGVPPMDFDTFKRNVAEELQDLKKKGEEMSQELKEFFRSKK
ncbi:MAG: PspC domain-containing protein [Chitinophagaceae bacterium]|nr:PspC domain-containing protein [Chitinophagaceae bacterium]